MSGSDRAGLDHEAEHQLGQGSIYLESTHSQTDIQGLTTSAASPNYLLV